MLIRPSTIGSGNFLAVAVLLVITGATAHAQKIYKSVDKEGNVTYSTTPPVGAVQSEKITPPSAPTAEQVREAEERSRQTMELADTLEKEREQREQAQREEEQVRQATAPPAPVYVPVPVPYPYYDNPLVQLPPARPARPSRPGGERPRPHRPRR